jgi:tetratricopeptide (TPR) repeat protein
MADDIRRWSDDLARDPSSPVFLQLGEALRRQGQLDLAEKIALRGLDRHPHSADAHDLVARIAVDRRDFACALERWEQVLRIVPDHLGGLKGLGYVCFQLGRFEDAERYLRRAAMGDSGDAISNALQTVRRSTGSMPAVADAVAAPADASSDASGDAQRMFADLLVDEGQTALLLDGSGYVLAGLYLDGAQEDVSQDVGAQLSGISEEVERSMRHLEIGAWRSIIFETQSAVVAMAPTVDQSLVVVAASRATPLGLLRRLLDRCTERATGWLQTGSAK